MDKQINIDFNEAIKKEIPTARHPEEQEWVKPCNRWLCPPTPQTLEWIEQAIEKSKLLKLNKYEDDN